MVLELGKSFFSAETPGEMVVVCYEAHMVCVDGSERSESVTDDREESDEDIIDYIDEVGFAVTDIDPACAC